MIEFVNKEDAHGPSIMEMAREIKDICTGIEYADCSAECECFDKDTGACRLYGDDPSDWDI